MVKGVFFDLYGTLFLFGDMKKAWADWLSLFHSHLQNFGLSLTLSEFSIECDQFLAKDEPLIEDKNLTLFEKRIRELTISQKINIPKSNIKKIANLIVDKWQEQVQLDPETIPVLKQLKGNNKVGLISNFDHPPHIHRYLSKYKMKSFFDTIIISGEVGVKKPDPKIFEPALAETNLNSDEIIYIGDTDEDIEAAKAANVRPILIKREGKGTDINALDYSTEKKNEYSYIESDVKIISSLSELIKIVDFYQTL